METNVRHLTIGDFRLSPLQLKDKQLFESRLHAMNIPLSDYSFANNHIWLSLMSGFHAEIEGCLCLFALSGETLTMMLPPLGDSASQRAALPVCFDLMDRYNGNPYLGKIEYAYRDFLAVLDIRDDVPLPMIGGEQWLVEPANPDYIYRTEDLVHLSGNRYKDKRNLINQFRRVFPACRSVPFGPSNRSDALALTHAWISHRLKYIAPADVEHSLYYIELERTAIYNAVKYQDELGLVGLCLYNGDEMLGFTLGERINSNVANVLIEKTNLDILGCAQYLFREFSKQLTDCEFINVGDDLGLENLRRVKLSYRPAMLGEKYTIKRFCREDDR